MLDWVRSAVVITARHVFHCSINILFFLRFYTSFRSFSDENVPHCLTLFKLPKNRQIHNVEEVRQDEPLGSLLCCWDRHFELRSYSRYRKSRIDYYCNSTACLNYKYLRLCGDINPNPGPASKKA